MKGSQVKQLAEMGEGGGQTTSGWRLDYWGWPCWQYLFGVLVWCPESRTLLGCWRPESITKIKMWCNYWLFLSFNNRWFAEGSSRLTKYCVMLSYRVDEQIQSLVQDLRGFGEDKFPDRFGPTRAGGVVALQYHCQLFCCYCWQLRDDREQFRLHSESENELNHRRLLTYVTLLPRHKPVAQRPSHRGFRSSVHWWVGAELLFCGFKIKHVIGTLLTSGTTLHKK